MARRKPEAVGQAQKSEGAESFTSIRITKDTHRLLLKISAKRLLDSESEEQESMDVIVAKIVKEHCKENYPELINS